jgi:hypothetical protein
MSWLIRPVPSFVIVYLLGLAAWVSLVVLLVLVGGEPEPSCEGTLVDGCLGIPRWIEYGIWLLVAVPACSILGTILALRDYRRGEDRVRTTVGLVISLSAGVAFASLYAIAA